MMDDSALSFSVRVLHLCYLPCGSLSKTSCQVSYTLSPLSTPFFVSSSSSSSSSFPISPLFSSLLGPLSKVGAKCKISQVWVVNLITSKKLQNKETCYATSVFSHITQRNIFKAVLHFYIQPTMRLNTKHVNEVSFLNELHDVKSLLPIFPPTLGVYLRVRVCASL